LSVAGAQSGGESDGASRQRVREVAGRALPAHPYNLPIDRAPHRGWNVAHALVTPRMPSLDVQGRRVHQVGLPYHWGGRGLVKGDVVNDLVAISEEPNVRIMESKALTCSVRKSEPAELG